MRTRKNWLLIERRTPPSIWRRFDNGTHEQNIHRDVKCATCPLKKKKALSDRGSQQDYLLAPTIAEEEDQNYQKYCWCDDDSNNECGFRCTSGCENLRNYGQQQMSGNQGTIFKNTKKKSLTSTSCGDGGNWHTKELAERSLIAGALRSKAPRWQFCILLFEMLRYWRWGYDIEIVLSAHSIRFWERSRVLRVSWTVRGRVPVKLLFRTLRIVSCSSLLSILTLPLSMLLSSINHNRLVTFARKEPTAI